MNALAGIVGAAALMLVFIACSAPAAAPPAPAVALTQPPPAALNTAAPASAPAAATTGGGATAAEAAAGRQSEAPTAAVAARPPDDAPAGLSEAEITAAHDRIMTGIYETALPSVVGLRIVKSVTLGGGSGAPGMMPPRDFPSRAAGSGFVWDDDGHILTNRHVVADAERILVTLSDGAQVDAEIVGADADSDLAIIRIADAAVRPPPIALGDSDDLKTGQLAIAIGDPFSRGFSMTSGIISAVGRTINPTDSNFSVPRVIQHDAATNPGNSGGPLLNRAGEVVGINTQIISQTGAFSGVGLAVPVNLAKLVAPALIREGHYEYPYIGIRGTTVGPDIARAMGLPADTRGALVLAVGMDSAAERGGLRASSATTALDGVEVPTGGDIIIAINGAPVRGMDDVLAYVVENTRPGDRVEFTVLRDGAETSVSVTMSARPR